MNNLFSIFDPVALLSVPLNWIASAGFLIILPGLFWVSPPQVSSLLSIILNFLKNEFSAILSSSFIPGAFYLTISLFMFILVNNFLGLFPYIFTSPSHPVFTVTLALPLWVGHIMMAWTKITQPMLAHLVPLGTPYPLTPFMVIIEIISNIIRPLTLSVRLAANMLAGHLLMALLSNNANPSRGSLSLLIISCLVLLCVLESAVAIIQSYVFSVLSTLYISEVKELN